MKKNILAILVTGALALAAQADLLYFKATSFNWGATPKYFDYAQIGVAKNGVADWGEGGTKVYLDIKLSADATASSKFLLANDTTRTVAGPAFADLSAYTGGEYTFYVETWDNTDPSSPAPVVSYAAGAAKSRAALAADDHVWVSGASMQTVTPWEVPESVVVPEHARYTMTSDATTATVNFYTDEGYAFADGLTNHEAVVSLTGGVAPVCSNVYYSGVLYHAYSTSGWSLYMDEDCTVPYADYTDTWTAKDGILEMNGFVHPGLLRTVPSDASLKLKGDGTLLVMTNDASVAVLSCGSVSETWVTLKGAAPAGGALGAVAWDDALKSFVVGDKPAQKLVTAAKPLHKLTVTKTEHVASAQVVLADGEVIEANPDGTFSIPDGAAFDVVFVAQDSYFFYGTKSTVTVDGLVSTGDPITFPTDRQPPDPIPHTHCFCGDVDCDVSFHATDQVWQCTATLPTTAGYWVLTNDVTIATTWAAPSGVTLCLCGHTIRYTGAATYAIDATAGSFLLTDCAGGDGRVEGGVKGGAIWGGTVTGPVTNESETVSIFGGVFNGDVSKAAIHGGVFNKSVAADCTVRGGVFKDASLAAGATIVSGFEKATVTNDVAWTVVGSNAVVFVGGRIVNGTFVFKPTRAEYAVTELVNMEGSTLTKTEYADVEDAVWTLTAPIVVYVSETGNDYLNNGSVSRPYSSLNKAYSVLPTAKRGTIALLGTVTAPAGAEPALVADTPGKSVFVTSADATGKLLDNAEGVETGLGVFKRSGCTGPLLAVTNGAEVTFGQIVFDGENKAVAQPLLAVGSNALVTNDVNAIWRNAKSAGNGGAVSNAASFVMVAGKICDCVATNGGAIATVGGQLTLLGGSVANCAASGDGHGGGVYVAGGAVTVGGTVQIAANAGENVYFRDGCMLAVSEEVPLTTAQIGVTTATKPTMGSAVAFSTNGALADRLRFTSDDAAYQVAFEDGVLKLCIPVATIEGSVTNLFSTITKSITHAQAFETVKLVTNRTENVTLPATKTNVLDLAGWVLKGAGGGSVVTVGDGAHLTITDTVATAVHNYYVQADGLWVLTNIASTVAYEALTARPAAGAVVAVKGGAITGGKGGANGGGVFNNGGFLRLTAGNVVGNAVDAGTDSQGGGVCSYSDFEMTGGRVIGNRSTGNAGGVKFFNVYNFSVKPAFDFRGGDINFNTAAYDGGGIEVVKAAFSMTNAVVVGNLSGNYGGGIKNAGDSVLEITGGRIAGNRGGDSALGGGVYNGYSKAFIANAVISGNTAALGGGVYNDYGQMTLMDAAIIGNTAAWRGAGVQHGGGKLVVGGALVVTNNVSDGKPQNVWLGTDQTLVVTNGFGLASDAQIGITMYKETGMFSTNVSSIVRDCFFSDNNAYYVKYDKEALSLAERDVVIGAFTDVSTTNYTFAATVRGGMDEVWFDFKNAQVKTTKYCTINEEGGWGWVFATNVTGTATNEFAEATDVGVFYDALQLVIAAWNEEAYGIAFTNAVSHLVVGNLKKGCEVTVNARPSHRGAVCVGHFDVLVPECKYNVVDVTSDTVCETDGTYSLREAVERYAALWDNDTNVVLGVDGPFPLDAPLFLTSNMTFTAQSGKNGLLFQDTLDKVIVTNDAVVTVDCPFKVQESYNNATNYLWLGTNAYVRMGRNFELQDALWVKTYEDLLTKGVIKVLEPVDDEAFTAEQLEAMRAKVHAYDPDHNGFTTVIIDGSIWIAARFLISYDAMDGAWADGTTVSNLLNYVADGYLVPEENPTRERYTFAGWYVSWTNGAKRIENGTNLNEYADHKIYAKWISKSFDPEAGEDSIRGKDLDGGAATVIAGATTNEQGEVTGKVANGELAIPERIGNGVDDGKFVTALGVEAYAKNNYDDKVAAGERLTSVRMPSFLTHVGDEAFYACTNMTNVTFAVAKNYLNNSNATLVVGARAFAGTSVETITFPVGSKTRLGVACFARCPNLKLIEIYGEIEAIGNGPFALSGDGTTEIKVRLSPKYAADAAFVAKLTANMNTSSVKIDTTPLGTVTLYNPSIVGSEVTAEFAANIVTPWGQVSEDSVVRLFYADAVGNLVGTGNFLKAKKVEDVGGNRFRATFDKPAGWAALPGYYQLTVGD